ncbi:MAG: HK97 gp10 family phage protein [Cyanobacteria bacterium J149]|nr:MAG: HK97 gp10 family phage protein [Cyanobacteria bacterium J149]
MNGTITITPTKNTTRLIRKLAHYPQAVTRAKRAGMIKATNIFRLKAVEEAPIRKGILRKSILTEVSNNGETGKVYSKLEYARYQEEGTGIYGKRKTPIVPKRAKYLRFKTKSGKIVYARKVRGTKPKYFMKKGLKYLQQRISKVNKTIIDSLRRGLYA